MKVSVYTCALIALVAASANAQGWAVADHEYRVRTDSELLQCAPLLSDGPGRAAVLIDDEGRGSWGGERFGLGGYFFNDSR